MSSALNGKTCLITGASRTLGAEIARRMAKESANIAINYHHSQAAALALCDELAALGGRSIPRIATSPA